MSSKARVVIVPGNGCRDVENSNWYGWVRDKLVEEGVEAVLTEMPDPDVARESIWIPFMRDELKCDERTIILGHSSGAEAAKRFAERYQVHAIVIVSPSISDQGDENERASGYYSRPWEWEKIKENTNFTAVFGSPTDPFIPWAEIEEVIEGLKPDEVHKPDNEGHFMKPTFPEVLKVIRKFIQLKN